MDDFWEVSFQKKQEMWGLEPVNSARLASELFERDGVKNVLIPGIGYGRNAAVFREKGMAVTGIEISKTAIEMANKHYGNDLTIYQGSVTDMPFDNRSYGGIFSHALIHLLDKPEREKFIRDCYSQLSDNGFMIFTAISKKAPTYRQGTFVGEDRYEQFGGVRIFFYDEQTISEEFGGHGLCQVEEISDNYPFHMITCHKSQR